MATAAEIGLLSRGVYVLCRAAGLDEAAVHAVGAQAATLPALAAASADELARDTRIDGALAGVLVAAAGLLGVAPIPARRALELARSGLSTAALATSDPVALAADLKGTVGVAELAGWGARAAATSRPPAPPSPLRPARPPRAVAVRRLVLDRDRSWAELVAAHYPRARGRDLAGRLAAANRADAHAPVAAGTAVVLPELGGVRPALPTASAAARALRAFAPRLGRAEAARLVEAGVVAPALVLATRRAPPAPLPPAAQDALRRLQAQAELASSGAVDPELAHFLAFERGMDASDLGAADVAALARDLAQARAIGAVSERTDVSIAGLRDVVGKIIGKYGPGKLGGLGLVTGPDYGVCARSVPPTTHLENYYTYRFAPGGRSADELQREIDARNLWLTLADDYLAGAPTAARTANLVDQGLLVGGISLDDLKPWGGTVFDRTSVDTLTNLRNFLRDNVRVVSLLQALAEAQEAYHRREYGLGLAAYARAEGWFATRATPSDPPSTAERWWRNEPSPAGGYKPSFLVMLERYPGDLGVQASYQPVHEYYAGRAAAADPETLLERLQVDVADYRRWRLDPAVEGAPAVPFRKFLYCIRNLVIPLGQADCKARLGDHCGALDLYLRVHEAPDLTQPLGPADEADIAQGVRGGPGPAYAPVVPYTVQVDPKDAYYPAYVNAVERRLVRMRVADVLLDWADLHYRRGEAALASARYAQVLRVHAPAWKTLRGAPSGDLDAFRAQVDALKANPRTVMQAFAAHQQLAKMEAGLNFLGVADDDAPIWTYGFLLATARYFAERARQLGRDAVQFLSSAEQEAGNRRLLLQNVAVAQGQLAVEARRVDEADAAVAVARAGEALAAQRLADNASHREEIDAFAGTRQTLGIVGGALGGASSGANLGGLGGKYAAAAGAGIGATYGGISSYISGQLELTAQRNDLERQRLELQKSQAMAGAETARALAAASVARLARNVASLGAIYAQSNLEYAQAKTLNAEFWYETALRLQDLAAGYLERAIAVAFLCEQAFEFMEGRRLDVIRLDYSQAEGVLAAEALLSDLDSIEYERISGRLRKSMAVKRVIRLREQDFFAFAELKRTGAITFETPLFDFDRAHPGSYHQRVAAVEVEVRALVSPEGVIGTLRKSGLSYLRYRVGAGGTSPTPSNTAVDWITHTPTAFRIAPVLQADETLVLSPYDVRRDAVILRPDPGEQLRVFENTGCGATWTLTLRPCSSDLDLATVTDVNLHVYYYSQFDDALARTVELESRKLLALGALGLQRTRGFSLAEAFPDELYALQNPPPDAAQDPWQRRAVSLEVDAAAFRPNQHGRALEGVVLAFRASGDFVDVRASLTSPALALGVASFQAAPGLNPAVRVAAGQSKPPEATWVLELTAADNPGLTLAGKYRVDGAGRVVLDAVGTPIADANGVAVLDAAKVAAIDDVWLIFNYAYTEAGACGEPIVLWSHFAESAQAGRAVNGAVQWGPWTATDLAGVGAWAVQQGRMTQSAPNAMSILRPASAVALPAVGVSAGVRIPAGVGNGAGLTARDGGAGAGRYQVRVIRGAADRIDVRLEEVAAGGAVTQLAAFSSDALALRTDFDLELRAIGTALEVRLSGRTLVRGTSATLATGTVGLLAIGAGVAFDPVLVSDLTGR